MICIFPSAPRAAVCGRCRESRRQAQPGHAINRRIAHGQILRPPTGTGSWRAFERESGTRTSICRTSAVPTPRRRCSGHPPTTPTLKHSIHQCTKPRIFYFHWIVVWVSGRECGRSTWDSAVTSERTYMRLPSWRSGWHTIAPQQQDAPSPPPPDDARAPSPL